MQSGDIVRHKQVKQLGVIISDTCVRWYCGNHHNLTYKDIDDMKRFWEEV